jgi:2-oxoglutarate ferredoxin oxidoreductase subunit beta
MKNTMPKCYKIESKPHYFCPGCGHAIILKQLGNVIDELGIAKNMVFGIDIGCSLLAWNFFDISTIQTHHGRCVPVMVGVKKASSKKIAIAYMGDGGGYAIGLQSLIHACFRNEPILAIVVNNTNYAMTGGQMAPTSFPGEITSTSSTGKPQTGFGDHFLGPETLAANANKNAYIERVSLSNPRKVASSLKQAIKVAQSGNFSFLEILSICPTNWKTNAHDSFEFLKQLEGLFPQKVFLPLESKTGGAI